jgi:hypothetical protein
MGIYEFSSVYVGRLLSREAHTRLLKDHSREELDGWLTDLGDPRGWNVLHPPDAYIQVGSMDGILEKHEISRGWVDLSEIRRILKPEQFERLTSLSDSTRDELSKFVSSAKDKDKSDAYFGIYVLQGELSTMDDPFISWVTHNIRCNLLSFPTGRRPVGKAKA